MENNRYFPPNTTGTMQSHFTVRDHFAGLAMQGLMTTYWDTIESYDSASQMIKCQVEAAYEYADAMMKERVKCQ